MHLCGLPDPLVEFFQADVPYVSDTDITQHIFGNPSLEVTFKAIQEQKLFLCKSSWHYAFFVGWFNSCKLVMSHSESSLELKAEASSCCFESKSKCINKETDSPVCPMNWLWKQLPERRWAPSVLSKGRTIWLRWQEQESCSRCQRIYLNIKCVTWYQSRDQSRDQPWDQPQDLSGPCFLICKLRREKGD